jgi:pyruvate dehydrogenase E2 component (dihydrolipoamide acetyltransferase)
VITKVIMPKLGMVMKEGLVVLWHAEEGAHVEAGKLLLEIESDKVTTEIEAPASGILRRIIVRGDEIVPCGTVVGIITDVEDEAIPALDAIVAESRAVVMTREQWEEKQTLKEATEEAGASEPEARVRISPAARKLAKAHGVDPSRIEGTGPGCTASCRSGPEAARVRRRRRKAGRERSHHQAEAVDRGQHGPQRAHRSPCGSLRRGRHGASGRLSEREPGIIQEGSRRGSLL